MSGAVLIIVLIVGFLAVLAIRALTHTATGHAIDVAGRAYEKRKKPSAVLSTALDPADALQAAQTTAQRLDPDASTIQDQGEDRLTITLSDGPAPSGEVIDVGAILDVEHRTRLELRSASSALGSDLFRQFQGSLLATLRQRDSSAKQVRK